MQETARGMMKLSNFYRQKIGKVRCSHARLCSPVASKRTPENYGFSSFLPTNHRICQSGTFPTLIVGLICSNKMLAWHAGVATIVQQRKENCCARARCKKKMESMFPPWYLIVDSLLLVVRLMHVWYSNSNSCTISFSNSVQRSCIRKKILTKMNSWDWFPLFEGGKSLDLMSAKHDRHDQYEKIRGKRASLSSAWFLKEAIRLTFITENSEFGTCINSVKSQVFSTDFRKAFKRSGNENGMACGPSSSETILRIHDHSRPSFDLFCNKFTKGV